MVKIVATPPSNQSAQRKPSPQKALALSVALLSALVAPGCRQKIPSATPVNFLGATGNVVRMEESVISWGHSFTLSMNDETIATVEQKKFKLDLATTFTLKDSKGDTLATARKKLLTFGTGTAIEVVDAKGNTLGSIEKEVIRTYTSIGSVYVIKNKDGAVQAQSDKAMSATTTFVLNDLSGAPVIQIKRDYINMLSDGWTMTLSPNEVDPRITAFVPAFKTFADAKK
jgi:uncharacterized protein YxjI